MLVRLLTRDAYESWDAAVGIDSLSLSKSWDRTEFVLGAPSITTTITITTTTTTTIQMLKAARLKAGVLTSRETNKWAHLRRAI